MSRTNKDRGIQVNYSKSPSWFRHMYMEKKKRRQVHMLEHEASKKVDEETIWPVWKKPFIYYW